MAETRDDTPDGRPVTLESLQRELAQVRRQFKQAVWVGSLAVTGLSLFGISKVADIEDQARKKVDAAVTKSVEFFDLMSNGHSHRIASSWSAATTSYEQALALRPEDEFVFWNVLDCYASGARIDAGLKLLETADRSGLLVRKFSSVWTQLNAGRLYMLAGAKDGRYTEAAAYHFDHARRTAQTLTGGELSYVLYSEGIFVLLRGDEARARTLFQQMVELDPRTRQWPAGDRAEPWFQQLLKVRPTLQADLEALFEAPSGG